MPTNAAVKSQVEQLNLKLPPGLIDLIRAEAAMLRVRPARVVADRLTESFNKTPPILPGIRG